VILAATLLSGVAAADEPQRPDLQSPSDTARAAQFDHDYRRLGVMQALYESGNPDLRKFKAAGGKLIAFQGLNDSVIPRAIVDYYRTVERTMGSRESTQDFFRLFLDPGVNHCSGGSGADAVDLLGHLEAWVEHGQAPDRLLSGHLKDPTPATVTPYRPFPSDPDRLSFTRPIYPYPVRAKYQGRGNPNDAANFTPLAP
jgi:feruloyl esterase